MHLLFFINYILYIPLLALMFLMYTVKKKNIFNFKNVFCLHMHIFKYT